MFMLSAMDPGSLPRGGADVWGAGGCVSGAVECGQEFADQCAGGGGGGEDLVDAGADAGDQLLCAARGGGGAKMKVRPTLILADLPGYGYAKISKAISAEWPKFIEPYLAERETLAMAVCLVDTNIPRRRAIRRLITFSSRCSGHTWWWGPRLTG